ncbi:hypothetical protein PsYK624_065510 [Phanerochaete sordida]|uniref:Uncharacterized protein n=1 Tax=Phanerochaete sordida TaxID=48140 RepID=A0A9P3LDJ2_9APHY|nr:hypothetical protein PsYK624_065510 [Phanerochaete sordida]
MQALSKLLYVFTLLSLTFSALAVPHLHKRLAPACDLSHDDINTVIPSNINDGQAKPLQPAIADHPTFVVLGVGYANYTCQDDGTWFALGGLLELYDLSCVAIEDREAKTQDVYEQWVAADPSVTALDIIQSAHSDSAYAWGQHYWVPDPNSPGDGSYNPEWDFASTVYGDVLAGTNHDDAYLIGYRTGIVPAPVDPADNIEWVTLSGYTNAAGEQYGHFADQVFRIFCYGGVSSAGSCGVPGTTGTFKTALNFWYYGGAFATD